MNCEKASVTGGNGNTTETGTTVANASRTEDDDNKTEKQRTPTPKEDQAGAGAGAAPKEDLAGAGAAKKPKNAAEQHKPEDAEDKTHGGSQHGNKSVGCCSGDTDDDEESREKKTPAGRGHGSELGALGNNTTDELKSYDLEDEKGFTSWLFTIVFVVAALLVIPMTWVANKMHEETLKTAEKEEHDREREERRANKARGGSTNSNGDKSSSRQPSKNGGGNGSVMPTAETEQQKSPARKRAVGEGEADADPYHVAPAIEAGTERETGHVVGTTDARSRGAASNDAGATATSAKNGTPPGKQGKDAAATSEPNRRPAAGGGSAATSDGGGVAVAPFPKPSKDASVGNGNTPTRTPTQPSELVRHPKEDLGSTKVAFYMLLWINTLANVDHGVIGSVLEVFESSYKAGNFSVGLLGFITYFSVALAAPPLGHLLSTVSQKTICLGALFSNGFATLSLSVAPNVNMMIISRAVIGCTQAVFLVYLAVWAPEFAPPGKAGTWIALGQVCAPLGLILGYLGSGLPPPEWWRFSLYVTGIALLCTAVGFAFLSHRYVDDPWSSPRMKSWRIAFKKQAAQQAIGFGQGGGSQKSGTAGPPNIAVETGGTVDLSGGVSGLSSENKSVARSQSVGGASLPRGSFVMVNLPHSWDEMRGTKLDDIASDEKGASGSTIRKTSSRDSKAGVIANVTPLPEAPGSPPGTTSAMRGSSSILVTPTTPPQGGQPGRRESEATRKQKDKAAKILKRQERKKLPEKTDGDDSSDGEAAFDPQRNLFHELDAATFTAGDERMSAQSVLDDSGMITPANVPRGSKRAAQAEGEAPTPAAAERGDDEAPAQGPAVGSGSEKASDTKSNAKSQQAPRGAAAQARQPEGEVMAVDDGGGSSSSDSEAEEQKEAKVTFCEICSNVVFVLSVAILCSLYVLVQAITYWSTKWFITEFYPHGDLQSAAVHHHHDGSSALDLAGDHAGEGWTLLTWKRRVVVVFAVIALTSLPGGIVAGGFVVDGMGGYVGLMNRIAFLKLVTALLLVMALVGMIACFAPHGDSAGQFYFMAVLVWVDLFFGGLLAPGLVGMTMSVIPHAGRPRASAASQSAYMVFGWGMGCLFPAIVMAVVPGSHHKKSMAALQSVFVLLWASFAVGMALLVHQNSVLDERIRELQDRFHMVQLRRKMYADGVLKRASPEQRIADLYVEKIVLEYSVGEIKKWNRTPPKVLAPKIVWAQKQLAEIAEELALFAKAGKVDLQSVSNTGADEEDHARISTGGDEVALGQRVLAVQATSIRLGDTDTSDDASSTESSVSSSGPGGDLAKKKKKLRDRQTDKQKSEQKGTSRVDGKVVEESQSSGTEQDGKKKKKKKPNKVTVLNVQAVPGAHIGEDNEDAYRKKMQKALILAVAGASASHASQKVAGDFISWLSGKAADPRGLRFEFERPNLGCGEEPPP
eukprot:g9236.t1